MILALRLLIVSLNFGIITADLDLKTASVTWTPQKGFQFIVEEKDHFMNEVFGTDIVSRSSFDNKINHTGWSFLKVKTNELFPDRIQAFAAGYIEGFLTGQIIEWYWLNTVDGYCKKEQNTCKKIQKFLRQNDRWAKRTIAKKRYHSRYWHQVALFYDQLAGVVKGYKKWASRNKNAKKISYYEILWMNAFGDIMDIYRKFSPSSDFNSNFHPLGSGSCSALIKIMPNNSDIYVSHVTWNSYQSMLRIIKRYDLGFHEAMSSGGKKIPGHTMTFSSYPSLIYSGDDFNVISSGMVVLETTIENTNRSLLDQIRPGGVLLTGVRATVANRITNSGSAWTRIFSKFNSGTYNNQWMIVDFKVFQKNSQSLPPKDLLWIVELLPGQFHAEDMTWFLKKHTYWPSYNSPYFEDIFKKSGTPALVEKYGEWFSYGMTPRAKIFRRDHSKVRSVESMIQLMRSNNFRHDPLSRCETCSPPYNGENAISARCDLNPANGTYPFKSLSHRSHGATDMKLTTFDLYSTLDFIAIGGPTYGDVEPFQWSKSDFGSKTPHHGMPDLWEFKQILTKWI